MIVLSELVTMENKKRDMCKSIVVDFLNELESIRKLFLQVKASDEVDVNSIKKQIIELTEIKNQTQIELYHEAIKLNLHENVVGIQK
jgi:hypothetical protein